MGKQLNKYLRLPDAARTADSATINIWSDMRFHKISSVILNNDVSSANTQWKSLTGQRNFENIILIYAVKTVATKLDHFYYSCDMIFWYIV